MLFAIVLAFTKIRETFPSVKKRKTRILDEKLTTKENHKESLVELIEEDGFLKTFWRFIHSTAILIPFQSVICRQTVCAAINTMTSMYITFPEIDEDDSIFDRYFIRFSHRLIRRVLRASLSTYGGIERFMRDEIDEDYGIRDIVDVQLRIGGIIQFLSTSDDNSSHESDKPAYFEKGRNFPCLSRRKTGYRHNFKINWENPNPFDISVIKL